MNEGTNKEPRFTGNNIRIMAGDQPFALSAKMTAPRLVDWDGDGDMDLIVGSFGDSFGQKMGGGVYLSINTGAKGKPAFGALRTLIPPSAKGMSEPTRPDAGLYVDAVDYDGDGDLDLVVGGYSMWTPKVRELSEAEKATVAKLNAEQAEVQKRLRAAMDKINAEVKSATEGMDTASADYRAKRSEIYKKHNDARTAVFKESQALRKQIDVLVPGPKREAFVWLYERL